MFFAKNVNRASRKSMIQFLERHPRYFVAQPWIQTTSYAQCVKVTHLGFDPATTQAACEVLQAADDYSYIFDQAFADFSAAHPGWYIGFNGQKRGYLVLYKQGCQGGVDVDEDYGIWFDKELVERVELVCAFDEVCDSLRLQFQEIVQTHSVIEITEYVPVNVKHLQVRCTPLV